MLQIRPANTRGHTQLSWLNSYHTFSFGDYYDPAHMGYSVLRVINDDTVSPGTGFDRHGHRDMEIITYVLTGALEHRDNLGNGSVIHAGEVQCMSAGTGILHSEFNASRETPVHFLQIWLEPGRLGGRPNYAQTEFSEQRTPGALIALAAGDGRSQALPLQQDAVVYLALPDVQHPVTFSSNEARHIYLQVAKGSAQVNGVEVAAGDGLATDGGDPLVLTSTQASEILLFDLP